jgi:hypothetical protein
MIVSPSHGNIAEARATVAYFLISRTAAYGSEVITAR